jgi:hypothetical protein
MADSFPLNCKNVVFSTHVFVHVCFLNINLFEILALSGKTFVVQRLFFFSLSPVQSMVFFLFLFLFFTISASVIDLSVILIKLVHTCIYIFMIFFHMYLKQTILLLLGGYH